MEQVYLAPCTAYQYEPLKQAVDDIFDHLAINSFLFQGANVVIKPNLLMKCNPCLLYTSLFQRQRVPGIH